MEQMCSFVKEIRKLLTYGVCIFSVEQMKFSTKHRKNYKTLRNSQNAMSECIFCTIVKGELPAYKLYEDDDIVSFLDIFPIHPGHALVIPKKHSVDMFDTDEELIGKMMMVAKKMAPSVMKGTKADGINIGMNNREAAGQEVFHAHIHIIPRYLEDGLKSWRKNLFKNDKHKEEVFIAIKNCL